MQNKITQAFDRIFVVSVAALMAAILIFGASAMIQLNDGRVQTVVTQLVGGR